MSDMIDRADLTAAINSLWSSGKIIGGEMVRGKVLDAIAALPSDQPDAVEALYRAVVSEMESCEDDGELSASCISRVQRAMNPFVVQARAQPDAVPDRGKMIRPAPGQTMCGGYPTGDAPDAVEALVKAHEKEIAVWSENYAALERKLDRVECLLQRAVDGYGQKMRDAKNKAEKRDWQTMLIAAVDIQSAALAAIRAGGGQ